MKKTLYLILALVLAIGMLIPMAGVALADIQICAKPASLNNWQGGRDYIFLWHFIINGITNPSLAPASIHVVWANGDEADVPLKRVTGPRAEYYTNANAGSTVVSACTSIYGGWDGQFNLSHVEAVNIEKTVNGLDADTPETGPVVEAGSNVTFNFTICNMGRDTLTDVVVNDDVYGYIGTIQELEGNGEGGVGECVTLTIYKDAECEQHTDTATWSGRFVVLDIVTDYSVTDPGNYFGGECVKTLEIPLEVTKTASASFNRTYEWEITKDVDKTLVKQVGGTATFNYAVSVNQTGFTDSGWAVSGIITVYNPNAENVTVNVTDTCPGADVTVIGGLGATIPAGESVDFPYSGTFASQPPYDTNITNSATATPTEYSGNYSGAAVFNFTDPTARINQSVNVTDTFAGDLGTVTAVDAEPWASQTFPYSRTTAIPTWGCLSYNNTAEIVQTAQNATQTVTVCGPVHTGALTIGFWQNKNGQAMITSSTPTGSLRDFLRGYAPFQDLSATASNPQVATYVYNIIKAANAKGTSMNAMLKAQMLATALDVYFSQSDLGNTPIDLAWVYKGGTYEDVSSAFGGAPCLTVSQMLTYAAAQSNLGGSIWYGQDKTLQELAKDAFDAINNQWAFAC